MGARGSIGGSKLRYVGILHPVVVSTLVVAAGLITTFLPPRYYERIIGEPDYMFANPLLFGYVVAMWAAFSVGSTLGVAIGRPGRPHAAWPKRSEASIATLLVWFGAVLGSLNLWAKVVTWYAGGLMASGTRSRAALSASGGLTFLDWTSGFLVAILPWAVWILMSGCSRMHKLRLWVLAAGILFGGFVYSADAILTATRGKLMILMVVTAAAALLAASCRGDLTLRALVRRVALLGSIAAALFIGVAQLRRDAWPGVSGVFSVTEYALVGYFAAAYNRLAAILHGILAVPYGGTQYYTLRGILRPPLSGHASWLDLAAALRLDLPESNEVWAAGFDAVGQAGLNRSFNWLTIFGGAYGDLGWYATLWFAMYGILSGISWAQFVQRKPWGIMVHPWILASLLTWWGAYNGLLGSTDTVVVLVVATAIAVSRTGLVAFDARMTARHEYATVIPKLPRVR